jgi:hypothetical protein
MHTLEQLQRGDLAGINRLDLNAGLKHFPDEIYALADSLEILNLSDNQLTTLPHDLSRLKKLRVIFCSGNPFTRLPEALGDCPALEMVGFKSCQVDTVPDEALPPALRWLILTDNAVSALPSTLGERAHLQKLMLAGNRLSQLPEGLAEANRLELLRVAANQLDHLPQWILDLPRLSWLAFAGNPMSDLLERNALAAHPTPAIDRSNVQLGDVLGQGASGVIRRAQWHRAQGAQPRQMAVKTFKGQITSDGLPSSEMAACLAAGRHPNLVGVVGPLTRDDADPAALLLELIDPRYKILAGPPSLESCTRDQYQHDAGLSTAQAVRIARDVASITGHLHRKGILHGDLYAHNLLVDTAGHSLLSDFGAASFFKPDSAAGMRLQRIEARAFGCLLEELIDCTARAAETAPPWLVALRDDCLQSHVESRPDFRQIQSIFDEQMAT